MSKSWWEIKILCEPNQEELIFWRLEKFGCRGMATQMKKPSLLVNAYLPQIEIDVLDLAALSLWLRQDAIVVQQNPPQVSWDIIGEEDWANNWKEHWEPREIGDRLWVYPSWLEPPAETDKIILRLDPGVAFGTGEHPTTELCLESLEMRLESDTPEEMVVADIGCGSGILSIAAILLGATQVYAVDIDALAVYAARSNRYLNKIKPSDLVIKKGSWEQLEELTPKAFDGIMCNIQADVISDLIPKMSTKIKPNGWAILSGILLEQAMSISSMVEKNGWVVAALWKRGDWCCFNLRRDQ